jgi:hypothetical protein
MTESDSRAAVRGQIRRLKVGSRDVVVETVPLNVFKHGGKPWFKPWTFRRPGDQLLVLQPSPQFRLYAVFCLFFGALPLWASVSHALAGTGHAPTLVMGAVVGCILILIGVGLWVKRRMEFDRAAGQMRTYRDVGAGLSLGAPRQRPLRDVLAVQLVRDPRRIGERSGTTWQLNLVLDDERQGRMNLSNHRDPGATRADGAELARFLGVPFLDEVGGGKTEEVADADARRTNG